MVLVWACAGSTIDSTTGFSPAAKRQPRTRNSDTLPVVWMQAGLIRRGTVGFEASYLNVVTRHVPCQ